MSKKCKRSWSYDDNDQPKWHWYRIGSSTASCGYERQGALHASLSARDDVGPPDWCEECQDRYWNGIGWVRWRRKWGKRAIRTGLALAGPVMIAGGLWADYKLNLENSPQALLLCLITAILWVVAMLRVYHLEDKLENKF